jgi:cobalt/nickel transport system permease protein
MHIADGIIATEICMGANAVAVGALYLSGRKVQPEEIPRMGFVGASLFAVSLLHFPLAGTSMHLSLLGLGGILLGTRVLPVLFVALLFQALLFQHGGFISVGLNTLNMGAGALAAGWIWRRNISAETLRAFLAGFVAIMLPAFLMGMEFYLTGYGRGMLYLLSVYAVLASVEGLLTATAVRFLQNAQPEILQPVTT